MKLLIKILDKIRCFIFLFPIAIIGVVTLPATILFNWTGFWIVCIANYECCSLGKAKKILLEGKKYKHDRWGLYLVGEIYSEDHNYMKPGSSAQDNSHITSPTYSYLSQNIFYSDNYND